jgi:uncharacterized glyoxalase superfamily protein PhnB
MASPVRKIPEGCHTVTPHLVVRDAARAIDFYKKAFGAKELSRSPGPDGKLMHAELKIGDSQIYLNDEYPGMSESPQSLKGSPVTIHLWVEDVDRVFQQAVAAGAKAAMPVADQFWGDRYGQVVDPFGHRWSMATHVKDLTNEQKQKAAEAAFAAMGKQ